MPAAPIPHNDRERIAALHSLGILDTDPEESFDRLTRLTQRVFNMPIAVVSLVDSDRQWFKSVCGLTTRETTRDVAFCSHAIFNDTTLVVNDAAADPRFSDNPLVTGEPFIRNRYGSISGPAIKPIGLRVVAELRDAGIRLPIIASAGIRDYDDCREFFWAGADAVSLGSEVWLAPYWQYALGPLRGLQIQQLIRRVERHERVVHDAIRARTRPGSDGGAARQLRPALGGDQQLLHR